MLQQLIAPVSLAMFWSEYFEKRPLHVARRLPEWCREMPSIDDLDAIISYTSAPDGFPLDELIRGSETHGAEYRPFERPDGRPEMSAIYRAYASGWSIAVYSLHRRSAPVTRLANSLASELRQKIHVNLYCTPSDARGLMAHADSHDVVVLQLEGRKSWRVFAPQYLLPLEGQRTTVNLDALGAPVLEATTEPGQILYLPRGFIHEAVRTSVPSMHLTIGIHPLRWLDMLEAAVRVVAERDVRFRRAAPSLAADEKSADKVEHEFASLLDLVHDRKVLLEAMGRCRASGNPTLRISPDPHFSAIEQARSLSGATEVARRLGWRTRVIQDNIRVRIQFGVRSLSAPLSVAPAFEFISEHEQFRVDDLPEGLSEQSKVVLVRRLIHEGLLKTVGRQVK